MRVYEASRNHSALVVKPARRISIIVSGVFLLLAIAGGIVGVRRPSFLNLTAVALAIAILWSVWVSSFLIRLTGDELVVRSMFGGTSRVDVSRVVNVEVRPGASLMSQLLSSGVEVAVDIAGAPSLIVNAAVFDARDLDALISRVRELSAARRAALADHASAEQS